jgi:hypothetical protein
MSTGQRFYEVRTEAGTFWVRAARGSDATQLARRIMTADPDAVYLFLTTDIDFTDMAAPVAQGLDWNQALALLRLKLSMTGAEHVLSTARVTGRFDGQGLHVRRLSVSPERFEITDTTEESS